MTERATPAAAPTLSESSLAFLAALAAFNSTAADYALPELREAAKRLRLPWNAGGPAMAKTRNLDVQAAGHTVPLRQHVPPGASEDADAIVYFHGGGWTLLGIDTHDRAMREVAAACACPVIGVDYPLAPETRFPATIDVCVDVVRACRAGMAGLRPKRLILAGDSAGANLAAATALALRDRGEELPAGLILIYGVFDCDLSRPSYAAFGSPPFQLTAEKMDWFWSQYVGAPQDRVAPLASPLRASLTGLPPTHMIIAEADCLADENEAFAAALHDAGVALSVHREPHLPHGFFEAPGFFPEAAGVIAGMAKWVERLEGAPDTAT